MVSLFPRRVGLVTQTLIPLIAGIAVVVGVAMGLAYREAVRWQRDRTLDELKQAAEHRSEREQWRVDRVARQLVRSARLLAGRIHRQDRPITVIPRDGDGVGRLLSTQVGRPLAAFVAPGAGPEQMQTAALACDFLAEMAPTWSEAEPVVTIAVPGCWLVGWGAEVLNTVQAMLPNDPVQLPAEHELMDGPMGIRWSRVFYEPGSDRWIIAASSVVEIAGIGRISVTQILPADSILRRATQDPGSIGDTAVIDHDGRLLAHSRLGEAIRSADGLLVARDAGDPLLTRALALVQPDGPTAELVADPTGACWIGVSRVAGSRWLMLTVCPASVLEANARSVALVVCAIGLVLVVVLSTIVVLVIRGQVGRPLGLLTRAASALAGGTQTWALDTRRGNELGDLSRAFQTMAEAVTVREADLQQALADLGERQALTRALVDGAPDAMLRLVDGRIVEANPCAGRLFGCRPEELHGRTTTDLSPAIQADGQPSILAAKDLLFGLERGGTRHFPWRHRRLDGSEFEAEVGLARIDLPGPPQMWALIRDVTQRVQMEAQLRQGQKLESLGRLAGGIAHDFNNVLAAIMGMAELLHRSSGLDDVQRQRVDAILTGCERAAGLTRKMLAFARKEHGKREPVDVHAVVRDTASMLEHSLGKTITIELDLQAEQAVVAGDAAQFQNVLINLAVNARDAMPDGGRLTIATAMRRLVAEDCAKLVIPATPGPYLDLMVRDTGIGIPPDVMGRIFEPFFTTKGVGEGTGLGLSAVYGTVQECGGSIGIDSQRGIGTTFHLFLPASSDLVIKTLSPSAITSVELRAGTVLLVEDEPVVRSVGCAMLEELGWTVIEAADGLEAVEIFEQRHQEISLVVLDMEMPRLRGVDSLRRMRVIDPAVRAILCSGYPRDLNQSQFTDEGFRALLRKPYRLEDMADAVRMAMEADSG